MHNDYETEGGIWVMSLQPLRPPTWEPALQRSTGIFVKGSKGTSAGPTPWRGDGGAKGVGGVGSVPSSYPVRYPEKTMTIGLSHPNI